MLAPFLEDPTLVVFTVALLTIIWILLSWMRSEKRRLLLPPGPPGWPVVKNLPLIFERQETSHDQFYYTRMAKEYGDIYKLEVGPQLQYVLSSVDKIREVFSHSQVQGRPEAVAFTAAFGQGAYGYIFGNGPVWKAMKQLTANVFQELGVGKGMFTDRILSETERVVAKLDGLSGSPCCDMMLLLSEAISNIMCGILFGRQFGYEDKEFREILGILKSYSNALGPGTIVQTSKILNALPFGPAKVLRGYLLDYERFLKQNIEENKKTSGSEQNNFVKAFLLEMEKGSSFFNEGNLIVTSINMFFAGSETSSATITYAIINMINFPDIQSKCQRELDSFTKMNGMPSYTDRSKLPLILAVIHETQRLASVSPLGVPHVVQEDLEFFGYDFPKGTVVVANFGSAFTDPDVFPEPRQFNPGRFIEDGEFKPHKDVIPFSVGVRACPGAQLARMELFLFLTRLLHRYTFSAPSGTKMPGVLDGSYGGAKAPPPFSVIITRREK